MSISQRLTQVRGTLDRATFGSRIGVSGRTVQRWELESAFPKGEELTKIALEFNVNLNWLLTGEGEPYLNKGRSEGLVLAESSEGETEYSIGVNPFRDSFAEAVSALREVFDSDDPIVFPALQANLRAFREAIRRERQIAYQLGEIEDLKRRVKALEGKGRLPVVPEG